MVRESALEPWRTRLCAFVLTRSQSTLRRLARIGTLRGPCDMSSAPQAMSVSHAQRVEGESEAAAAERGRAVPARRAAICTRIASAAPCRVQAHSLLSPLPPPAGSREATPRRVPTGPATSSLVPSRFKSARIHCEDAIAVTSYVPFFRLLLKKAVAQLPNDLFHYFAT